MEAAILHAGWPFFINFTRYETKLSLKRQICHEDYMLNLQERGTSNDERRKTVSLSFEEKERKKSVKFHFEHHDRSGICIDSHYWSFYAI